MKLTLLQVVQSYLNRTNDIYVNSIFDSDTPQAVAQIAEEVYYHLIQKFRDWQFTTEVGTLDNLSDPDLPNYLLIPSEVQRIDTAEIAYNRSTDTDVMRYGHVEYMDNNRFLSYIGGRSERLNGARVIEDPTGVKYVIYENRYPSACTSFDGKHLVFDAFNSDYEDTLQGSKSRVKYTKEQVFLQQDDFVIPIPEHMSGLYQDMVNIECYENLLQQSAPPTMVRRATARLATAQQQERTTGSMHQPRPRYGRR